MNGHKWTPEHTDMLLSLYATHHDQEIADRTGHHPDTVQRRRRDLGLPAYYGRTRYGSWQDIPSASLAAIRRAARMAA